MAKRKRKSGKYVSIAVIRNIKRLLNGHRLEKGYRIVKRKRKRK